MVRGKMSKAYMNVILALLIWGTIGVFRRNIPLSSSVLAGLRGFLGVIVLCIPTLFGKYKSKEKITGRNLLLLIVCGGFLGANWIFLFESYRYTTVATATLCYYMQPTILILLSPLFFSERLNLRKIFCMLLSLVGMIFLSGVLEEKSTTQGNVIGIMLGLTAAVLYALVVIINKKLTVDDALAKTRIQLLSAAVILTPYILMTENVAAIRLDAAAIATVAVVGVVHTGIAYLMFYGNVSMIKAQSVAVLSYIDPVFALILSALILHESMSVFGIIGAVCIIGAALWGELMPEKAE